MFYLEHKFAFSVAMSDKKKKYVLVFNTLEEKMTWMRDIQKYVELFLSKRNKELKNMEDLKQVSNFNGNHCINKIIEKSSIQAIIFSTSFCCYSKTRERTCNRE